MTATSEPLSDAIGYGVAASRPAAGKAGRLYYASDTSTLSRDNGTSWDTLLSAGLTNPMTTQDDIIVGGSSGAPTRLAKGSDGQVLTVDPTTHHLVWTTAAGSGTVTTVEEVDGSPTDSAVTKIVFPNGTLGITSHVATYTPAMTTVTAVVTADRNTNNTSTWTDVTDLTGLSLVAGTWIALLDVEISCATSYGAPFRVWDGTTTYVQAEFFYTSPITNISSHWHVASQPFTLGSSATMAVQYFSDTVVAIKRYPSRGSISAAAATHVTFMKIA